MKHEQLDQKLTETLEGFKEEVNSKLTMLLLRSDQTVKREDLENLSQQVFHCLDSFRTIMVNHMKEQELGE